MESFHFPAKRMPKTKIEQTRVKTLCLVFHFKGHSLVKGNGLVILKWFSVNIFALFISTFGCAGFSLLCADLLRLRRMEASHCGGFSCCGEQVLGCPRFSRCGTWAQCRLSCPTLYGIFPTQGSNLCPLCWQVGSLPLSHLGSLSLSFIQYFFN